MWLHKLTDVKWHVVFWTGFIIYEVLIVGIFVQKFGNFWDYALHYVLHIVLFYFHANVVLPSTLGGTKRSYFKLSLFVVGELSAYFFVKYEILWALYAIHVAVIPPYTTDLNFVLMGLWRGIYFLGFSTAYWFALTSLQKQKKVAQLERQNLINDLEHQRLEKVLLTTENAYLKSQINPHFLLNTLNFLYNSVSKFSDETAEGVMALSEIMRYALTDADQDGKVSLEAEIEHIQNFIKLNQARFSQGLYVDFQISGDIEGRKIIPLVLLTLTENVFKYGNLLSPKNPARISLNVEHEQLTFETENQKRKSPPDRGYGLGIENVKQRMSINYAYDLVIEDAEDYFKLALNVKL